MAFSKGQIDKLGGRLKQGPVSDDDLRLLDEYRRLFEPASSAVVKDLIELYGVQPTARPAKSTLAIAGKLRQQSVRLSQM